MKLQLSGFQRPTIYSECINSNDGINLQLLLNCNNAYKACVIDRNPSPSCFLHLIINARKRNFIRFNMTIACLFPNQKHLSADIYCSNTDIFMTAWAQNEKQGNFI